jgi:hypothetical protein
LVSLTEIKAPPFSPGWRYQPGLKVLAHFLSHAYPLAEITSICFKKMIKTSNIKIL